MRKNRITSWILTLALLIGGIPIGMDTSYAAKPATPTNGSFFTVSGSMITGYTGTEAVILIPQTIGGTTITTIGASAFKSKTVLTEVYIQDGINNIGNEAFSGCSNLTVVELPSTLTQLGQRIFYNCSKLNRINSTVAGEVILPEGITLIGTYAFYGCKAILFAQTPSTLSSIPSYLFYGCTSLVSANILAGDVAGGSGMFSGCSSLETVNLPADITILPTSAFKDCFKLKRWNSTVDGEINIPSTVTTIKGGGYGTGAFTGCSSITSVNIPSSVTSIEGYAFSSCAKLSRVNSTVDGEINLPATVISLGTHSFGYCPLLLEANVPEEPASYSNFGPFVGCTNLKRINSTLDGVFNIPSSVKSLATNAFGNNLAMVEINLPDGIPSIPDSAFSGCRALKRMNSAVDGEVNIPSTVTALGISAFNYCVSIQRVNIPSSVTSLGNSAFSECTNLSSINSTVDGVVNFPNGIIAVPANFLYKCSKVAEINLPEGITGIGNSAFYGNSSLLRMNSTVDGEINLPETLTTIGNDVFRDCTKIVRVNLPDGLTNWLQSSLFYNCSSLVEVNASTTHNPVVAGSGTFQFCTNLSRINSTVDGEINLPTGITGLGINVFQAAQKIRKVNIPDGVITIGSAAFRASSLEEISLPGSVTTINSNVFYATLLKRVNSEKDGVIVLGENVKTLGAYVFYDCTNIKEIYLNTPDTMSIGSGNLVLCNNLEAIYSYGNTLTDTNINTVIKLINSTGETVQATLTDDATAKNYSFGDYTQIQVRTKTTTYSWALEPAAILAKTSGVIEGNTTTYNILAEPIAVIGIAITQNPKTSYIIGDSFDPSGMVVERLWNNGTSDPITDYTIGDYPDPLPVGTTMIPISWNEYTIQLEVVTSDKPADVSATVTLSTYFVADANTGVFVAPDIEIENTCSGLIRISAVGVEEISGPEVVLPETKNWGSMGQADSESYIALGLAGSGVDVWLLPTMEPEPLLDIAPGDIEKLSLQGMFGKAWASGTPLKYRIQFKFDLVE